MLNETVTLFFFAVFLSCDFFAFLKSGGAGSCRVMVINVDNKHHCLHFHPDMDLRWNLKKKKYFAWQERNQCCNDVNCIIEPSRAKTTLQCSYSTLGESSRDWACLELQMLLQSRYQLALNVLCWVHSLLAYCIHKLRSVCELNRLICNKSRLKCFRVNEILYFQSLYQCTQTTKCRLKENKRNGTPYFSIQPKRMSYNAIQWMQQISQ